MAYRKRYRKKRTYKRKAKGANDKTVTVWSDHSVLEKANKALSLASKVYRFVNTEVKHFDTNAIGVPIPTSGNIIGFATVPQGDGVSTRDGDSLKPLQFTLRMRFYNSSSHTGTTTVRFILFRGKQENGSGYATTDILESAVTYSPKNYSERFRTKILMDRTYTIEPNFSGQVLVKNITYSQKMIGHVEYATGTTGIENGGLYLLCLTDVSTNVPSMDYRGRLSYVDN